MMEISIQNLSFWYNSEKPLMDGISLELDSRPTAIIGQNGAGKTTLVKLIKGLLKPSAGSIHLYGKDTRYTSAKEMAGYAGLVFQNPNDQIFKKTVLDEVEFGPLAIGMPRDKARKNSIDALKMTGLAEKSSTHPYDLPLSERKLTGLASVLAMDPRIIILDEPTIGQDWEGQELLKQIIRRLIANGKTVLSIIHDMDFAAEMFERIIILHNGRVLYDGTPKEVFSQKELLVRASLDQPLIMQAAQHLGYQEPFLTIEEFRNYIKEHKCLG